MEELPLGREFLWNMGVEKYRRALLFIYIFALPRDFLGVGSKI